MSDMPGLLRAYLALDKQRMTAGLSPAELARWAQLKASLNRHFQPGVDDEHAKYRESVRVPLRLNIDFESHGQIRSCLMTNLSAGGLFVATKSPLPIGTPFNLRIRIEGTREMIELSGEVASLNLAANLATEERGMGIRFVNLSDAQRQQVSALYEDAIQKVIGREASDAS